ncbi:hypothetical protein V8O11_22210 [Erwinia aphidicola]|uniref:hypothetical protein n=1 Tax=Erwinia aphidicola TaxID=68334 RepID=UPI00300D5F61
MKSPNIIGLAADHPGAGKDTAFAELQKANPETQFVNVKFADALTDEVAALFPKVSREDFLNIRNDPALKDYPFNFFKIDNIDGKANNGIGSHYSAFLYNHHRELIGQRISVRQHLLIYGTEFTREFRNEKDKWLDLGLAKAASVAALGAVAVVTDVRFPNEAKRLKEAGAELVHIAADGLVNAGLDALTNIAEGHLDGWRFDLRVKNVWGKPENMGVQFNAKYRW